MFLIENSLWGCQPLLKSLTSFRFIAALMVFIFHMEIFSQYNLGSVGVQFFFVLSGFILAYNYHSKFPEINITSLKKFYRARFAKVYPVHILTFLIAAPIVILTFKPDGLYFLKLAFMSLVNLLLIQSFIPNQATNFNFNGVSWTLSVEAFFYLMFPFLLWIISKIKLANSTIMSFLAISIVWATLFIMNANLDENSKFYTWLLHIFPVTRLFEFTTGIIMGLLFCKSPKKIAVDEKKLSILEFLSLGLFALSLWYSVNLDVGIVRGVYFVPVWCVLIYTFAQQGGIFSKILANRILVYLGEISFSFYMIHQLIIRYYEILDLNTTYRFLICLGLSLTLSAIMYTFFEEPLRKKLRYGTSKKEILQQTTQMSVSKTA
jgi:peptidoglycan/LPS O-acetylase OafA/YrhL